MGISYTRLKGKGMKESHNDYVLIWSGVDKNKRAVHGVGFYLHPELAKNIMEVDYISERIIRLRIQQEKEVTTYIQVYAPCNDSYSDEDKDTFFEELSDVINSTKNQDMLVVMGDMNGHVGNYLGPHSAPNTSRNYNGQLILELCAQHDLFVTNTFFQHRSSQIFTWYKWNDLTKASQLDFILIKKTDRCKVNDSKAMPNIHIDTDHRPVMMETSARRRPRPNKRQQPETINLRKLAEEPVKAAIEQQMDQLFQKLPDQEGNTEEEWTWFKDALTDTLKANCGTKKRKTGQVKGTSWWNDTVKAATKEKKRLFKKWSKSNLEADYNEYREARRNCKKTIKEAKDQSWKTYGEDLAEKSSSSSREFFRAVKAYKQRDEPFDPTAIINDKDGNPLTDSCKITNRWGEYFEDLLNPSGDGDRQQQQPFHPRFQEEVDPPILQEEVRNAIKTSPENKAAGIDDITTEAIRACGDTGVKWLTRVFNRAWEERAVPDDWQRAIIVPIWKKKGVKEIVANIEESLCSAILGRFMERS
ncbi:uncharacterized protein [Amphiura filiformis]|uniref:uncharacterized protein n=1 Tax=Amphiura filiformis TaxID=82378 RepID=UPI003B228EF5